MSAFLEHYDKKHLELLLAVHRVRVPRRHNDRLSLVNKIRLAVYREPSPSVKAGHKRVSARFVRAYLLSLVKGKKRYTYISVLRKSLADDLPILG